MTRILRHRGLHRETDGAIDWNMSLRMFCCSLEMDDHEWFGHPQKGATGKDFSVV